MPARERSGAMLARRRRVDVSDAKVCQPTAHDPRDLTNALRVLYHDEHLVVIDKPSGLLVHRSPIDRHETRFAVQLLRDQLGRRVYPVHRLDKGTSGALAFALDRDVARALAMQFATREVHKLYHAVVRGWPPALGEIDHALPAVQDDVLDHKLKDRVTRSLASPRSRPSSCRCASIGIPRRVTRCCNWRP